MICIIQRIHTLLEYSSRRASLKIDNHKWYFGARWDTHTREYSFIGCVKWRSQDMSPITNSSKQPHHLASRSSLTQGPGRTFNIVRIYDPNCRNVENTHLWSPIMSPLVAISIFSPLAFFLDIYSSILMADKWSSYSRSKGILVRRVDLDKDQTGSWYTIKEPTPSQMLGICPEPWYPSRSWLLIWNYHRYQWRAEW